jgi:hypothetical protein
MREAAFAQSERMRCWSTFSYLAGHSYCCIATLWLTRLGFQHIMLTYRDFELHRFSGAGDTSEGRWLLVELKPLCQPRIGHLQILQSRYSVAKR